MANQPRPPEDMDREDDYDDIPLQHKRPFGAGLHRKKAIAFVPASDSGQLKSVDGTSLPAPKPQPNIADLYLSMVLPQTERSQSAPPAAPPSSSSSEPPCPVCNLPLEPIPASTLSTPSPNSPSDPTPKPTPHTQSLAHQLCLPHSHPPSALDRTRMGLSYLSAHGWDPDARRGLGAAQQGVAYPVKARVKEDKLGVGMRVPKGEKKKREGEGKLLDAGKVRKMVREEARRRERVREELFGDGRVERYLGKGQF